MTLREPSVQAILTQADNRDLRARVAKAYATRASDHAADPAHDNSVRIDRILALRHEAAQLLGFNDAAAPLRRDQDGAVGGRALAFLSLSCRAGPAPWRSANWRRRVPMPSRNSASKSWSPGTWAMSPSISAASDSASFARRSAPYFPLPRVMEGTVR